MRLPKIRKPVAYFCSEFAVDNELPNYSGGLGILAGDVLNEAAVNHFPMVGMGILYKGKDYMQHITAEGKAETRDSEFDHDTSFLRPTTIGGKSIVFSLNVNEENIKVKAYHVRLSDNVIIFFLSTDIDGNPTEWISDMNALYRGDSESQIRQQMLLGIGGIKLLEILKITPSVYHINEGRPEFIIWEIAANLMKSKKVGFEEAWNLAKEKIVYTNHTLVSAGNLSHPYGLIEKYAKFYASKLGIDEKQLTKDGSIDPQTFNTTLFALNISKKQSAVSKIHGEYSKREWPNYDWIPITNGVCMPRWQDSEFRDAGMTDENIWHQHMLKKQELMETVVQRTGFGYDPNRLVITWARRLAEYKQPKIIFSDVEKLKAIISKADAPVQILFAGNSHTADNTAKSIIEDIIKIFSSDLSGHAIFVPNYNISLSNHLTSGSDIWLNTPKGNLEACGTSGMKAISNGVLNCTVLDGWTYEVNWDGIGWVLNPENIAGSFYDALEKEIIPMYYKRNDKGIPIEWIQRMRRSIELSKSYSAERMLEEYKKLLYS